MHIPHELHLFVLISTQLIEDAISFYNFHRKTEVTMESISHPDSMQGGIWEYRLVYSKKSAMPSI